MHMQQSRAFRKGAGIGAIGKAAPGLCPWTPLGLLRLRMATPPCGPEAPTSGKHFGLHAAKMAWREDNRRVWAGFCGSKE
jgi:hypothetical protein